MQSIILQLEILQLRDTSTSRYFNFEILQEHLVVEYAPTTPLKISSPYLLRVVAPKAIIEKSFTHALL
jgi:hypothetical protein